MRAHLFIPGRPETFHRREGSWLRDVVLGANDGLVSVLALIAGVAGAAPKRDTVLIAGVAAVVAGAISMSLGAFVAARSYRAFYERELERERWEMENLPDIERDEIRKIYAHKGFSGAELETVVERITSDPEVWLSVMMTEELGLSTEFGQPLKTAGVMFVAFALAGAVPVIPWLFARGDGALAMSIGATAIALFAAGWARTLWTGERAFRSGLELVVVATVGVAVTFGIGHLVGAVV